MAGFLLLAVAAAAFTTPLAHVNPRVTRHPAMMADVTVKFPGGKSATVADGAPLSLAAYQVRADVRNAPPSVPSG